MGRELKGVRVCGGKRAIGGGAVERGQKGRGCGVKRTKGVRGAVGRELRFVEHQ